MSSKLGAATVAAFAAAPSKIGKMASMEKTSRSAIGNTGSFIKSRADEFKQKLTTNKTFK
jgi:hypothetical protein